MRKILVELAFTYPILARSYCLFLLLTVSLSSTAFSQPATLKASITDDIKPADTTPIEQIKTFTGDIDTAGYEVGDTIPNFTLYTLNGTPVNIGKVLSQNKPVLLISGSYTCPHFRDFIPDMNKMATFYKDRLDVYLVYTLEAHPTGDPDPFDSDQHLVNAVRYMNHMHHVMVRQPMTYGARKQAVDSMIVKNKIVPKILLDDTGNEWWEHFGPASNNAYLLNSKGVVVAKNAWFNDPTTTNMWCNIDKLLGTHSGKCNQ